MNIYLKHEKLLKNDQNIYKINNYDYSKSIVYYNPEPKYQLKNFLNFVNGAYLICYDIDFNCNILMDEIKKCELPIIQKNKFICVKEISEKIFKFKNINEETKFINLCNHFEIFFKNESFDNCLSRAIVTAKIFICLNEKYKN